MGGGAHVELHGSIVQLLYQQCEAQLLKLPYR